MSSRRTIRISYGPLAPPIYEALRLYVEEALDTELARYHTGRLYYVCLSDACYIMEGAGKIDSLTLLYRGKWVGVIIGKKPYLSPQIYEEIYRDIREFKAAILVNEQGIKNFLYGKDILPQSIINEYTPTDSYVAVIDRDDNRVVGVARRFTGKKVYRNIYDLGIFLRGWG